MPFDAQMLVIAGTSLVAIVSTYGWVRLHVTCKDRDAMILAQASAIRTLNHQLHDLQVKDARRVEKCRAAAAKGKATQVARAAEAKAQRTREANARTAATLKAINDGALTGIRTRAQVVATVKAKRTRAKKSAGGVAPSKAG